MRENYTLPRLHLDAPLKDGANIALDKAQAHYIGTVLRREVGESVRVFNGRDGEWRAQITKIEKKRGALKVTKQLRAHQASPDIWLCFAPVRKHRNAFIFEKGTELGVACFQPVLTARTQFPKMRMDKDKAQIIEAAEQTERLDIPTVRAGMTLTELLSGWDKNRLLIFADEAGDAPRAREVLSTFSPNTPCAILIGPEGGFTPEERETLRRKECVRPVSLGPRILRADTAALSLLTIWQTYLGDW